MAEGDNGAVMKRSAENGVPYNIWGNPVVTDVINRIMGPMKPNIKLIVKSVNNKELATIILELPPS